MDLQIPKWLLKLSDNLYMHEFPFWASYKAGFYNVTDPEGRQIVGAAQREDFLLRKYTNSLMRSVKRSSGSAAAGWDD